MTDRDPAGVSPTAQAAVSFVVSFAEIRGRPPSPTIYGRSRSRTVPAWRERWGALLESVLVPTAIRETPSAVDEEIPQSSDAPYARPDKISASAFPQVRGVHRSGLRSRERRFEPCRGHSSEP